MEIIDFFTGGLQQVQKKRLVFITNGLVWLLVLALAALLLSWILLFKYALLFSFFHISVLAVTYYSNIYLVDNLIEQRKYTTYVTILILVFTIVVVVRVWFNGSFFENIPNLKIPINESWTYFFSFFTTFMVVVLSFFHAILINRSKKEKEYLEVISRQQESQLQFLKAQMSPHFLFNTLNNIYSLTIDKAPQASEMLLLLSDILRYAIYESKNLQVSLYSEVSQVTKLIDLYQLKSEIPLGIRFENRISSPEISIEPMILIPLVENCFKHGNIQTADNAFISIQLLERKGIVNFRLSNSKDNSNSKKDQPGGIGLKNIKQRLSLRYPDHYSLDCREEATSYSVNLEIDTTHG